MYFTSSFIFYFIWLVIHLFSNYPLIPWMADTKRQYRRLNFCYGKFQWRGICCCCYETGFIPLSWETMLEEFSSLPCCPLGNVQTSFKIKGWLGQVTRCLVATNAWWVTHIHQTKTICSFLVWPLLTFYISHRTQKRGKYCSILCLFGPCASPTPVTIWHTHGHSHTWLDRHW